MFGENPGKKKIGSVGSKLPPEALLEDLIQPGEGILGHTLEARSLFCYGNEGENIRV